MNDDAPATRLRLLIVEDSDDDAVLLVRHLGRAGYDVDFERVESGDAMVDALERRRFDVVITDHNLPGFSSREALEQCARADPDVPVIIVSGTIGEEHAVEAMRAGARDYIMKDNMARLVPAIGRELEAARVRRAQRAAERAVQHMAYHDALTGLVNRSEFERRLVSALDSARDRGRVHALCFLDLDQFKIINDTAGHGAGDALLRELAGVLQGTVRHRDTLARLGGDEFGILMEDCGVEQAVRVAEKICAAVEGFQFVWADKMFRTGCSIGLVAVTGARGETVTSLLSAADSACYAAKDGGRGRVHVYREDDEHTLQRRNEMEWVSHIHRALDCGALTLAYQPIVCLRPDAPVGPGVELLVRMRDADGQLIRPGAFLPAAERYGLAADVDRRVVSEALRWLAATPELTERLDFFAINLSATSLSRDDFRQFVVSSIRDSGIDPPRICFEITETGVIASLSRAVEFIRALKELGCRLALDDFGSGMCSFAYLKTLPVDFLKVDGTFVRDIVDDPIDLSIVRSINDLAHVMGMTTIAEFVENEETRARLAEMGVDLAQGHHLGGPYPIERLADDLPPWS